MIRRVSFTSIRICFFTILHTGTQLCFASPPANEVFLLGKTLASEIAKKVPRCKIALGEEIPFYSQLTIREKSLSESLTKSELVWNEKWPTGHSQTSCAFTERQFGGDILLSKEHCKATQVEDAAELLLHEGLHSLGISDENLARQGARRIMQDAESKRCGKFFDSWKPQNPTTEESGSFAAIAVDDSSYKVGFVIDAVSAEEARSLALMYCGSANCKIKGESNQYCFMINTVISKDFSQSSLFENKEKFPYVKNLQKFIADVSNDIDSRPKKDISFGVCPFGVVMPDDDGFTRGGIAFSTPVINPSAKFAAIAASEDLDYLASSEGFYTRYEAEQAAVKKCNEMTLNDSCKPVASVRGLTISARGAEMDRCTFFDHCSAESSKINRFIEFEIRPDSERFSFLYNFNLNARVIGTDPAIRTKAGTDDITFKYFGYK